MKYLVILSTLAVACSAFLLRQEKWNDLKVTWGPNPLNSNYFVSMPRTTADAIKAGFKKISDCDTSAKWRGARYMKDNDVALVLLYDVNGYIAGIQTMVPKTPTSKYPSVNLQPPFVEDGNRWVISAYFTDPAKICTTGRTAAAFNAEGTGSNLYIQNSTSPEASVMIPHKEADIGSTKWTKGKCFYTMGVHYWYNLSKDMSCDDYFPVFLLYNKGELTAFGWALMSDLPSIRYEHPPQASIAMFMETVPTCLSTAGTLSTMHIYLTGNVALDLC